MIIKQIEGFTRTFGKPDDWQGEQKDCASLSIRDIETNEGNFMVSAWEPTPEELEAINRGESIKLWIRGTVHPVVCMTVGDQ